MYAVAAVVIIAVYGCWAWNRTLPPLEPLSAIAQLQVQSPASKLAWPSVGESAVGVVDSSILETHGVQTPLPTASTAKLITALAVLHQKPLTLGQQGPTITLTASDVALYTSYANQEGSVVQVAAGEQISEYQMLEALLLPSANNMADSLAVWAFGSLRAYSDFANTYVKQLGLTNTHIGSDASGLAPTTTSTASDLVRLGELAMQQPVLAQIVGQPTASGIPMVGTVKNVNFLLGTDNIVGIKTGNSNEVGGVFVSAARTTVNGKPVTIITALSNAATLFEALKYSLPLIQSAQTNFTAVSVVKAGAVIGHYHQPWGGTLTAIADKSIATHIWNSTAISPVIHLQSVSTRASVSQVIGSITIPKPAIGDTQAIAVKLQIPPTKPTIWWRLLHPLE